MALVFTLCLRLKLYFLRNCNIHAIMKWIRKKVTLDSIDIK